MSSLAATTSIASKIAQLRLHNKKINYFKSHIQFLRTSQSYYTYRLETMNAVRQLYEDKYDYLTVKYERDLFRSSMILEGIISSQENIYRYNDIILYILREFDLAEDEIYLTEKKIIDTQDILRDLIEYIEPIMTEMALPVSI